MSQTVLPITGAAANTIIKRPPPIKLQIPEDGYVHHRVAIKRNCAGCRKPGAYPTTIIIRKQDEMDVTTTIHLCPHCPNAALLKLYEKHNEDCYYKPTTEVRAFQFRREAKENKLDHYYIPPFTEHKTHDAGEPGTSPG